MALAGLLLLLGILTLVSGVAVVDRGIRIIARKVTQINSSRRTKKEGKPGYSRGFALFQATFWRKDG